MSIESAPHGGISVRRSKKTERLLLPANFITTAGNAFQLTAASILVFHAASDALAVAICHATRESTSRRLRCAV